MKKKFVLAVSSILVFLVVFIPLASTNPDGLEKVAISLGANEGENLWNGILPDYSVLGVKNGYLSTLIAGVIGVVLVLLVGLFLSRVLKPKTINSNSSG
jgi:ABC-type sulfate transport system permease component